MENAAKKLTYAFAALLVLMAGTVAGAHWDVGQLDIYLAFAFALAKTAVILVFFMHFRQSGRPSQMYFLLGVLTFIVLAAGVIDDLVTREI